MTTLDTLELWAPARVRSEREGLARGAAAVVAAAVVMGLSAKVRIPLPFTPVPITGQTFVALLAGATLGPWLGAGGMLTYLAAGVAGLPVFAAGGGPLYLAGPTGGYLVGFVAGSWVVGALVQRGWGRSRWLLPAALLIGDAVIFAAGMTWLAVYFPAKALPLLGLVGFLPGEAVKIALAATIAARARS